MGYCFSLPVRSSWRGERNYNVSTLVGEENKPPFIRVWKPSSSRRVLKPRGKPERESLKRIISASSGSGPLQMVSELDTGRCFPKGVDLVGVPYRLEKGTSASEDAGSRREMDCDVPHWLGRRTNHPL